MFFFGYEISIKEQLNTQVDKIIQNFNQIGNNIENDKKGKRKREILSDCELEKKNINERKMNIGLVKENIKNDKRSEKKRNNISYNKEKGNQLEERRKKKNKKSLKGDIDFLLPNVTPLELEKVLLKKEFAPFVFYGNIDMKKTSDLIGEIKEDFQSGIKNNIKQFHKYSLMIKIFKNNISISKKYGIKPENQKILVYVFNSSYKDYLKKMLTFQIHKKKFCELNDKTFSKNIFSYFKLKLQDEKNDLNKKGEKAKYEEDKKKKEEKEENADLIDKIVNSGIPYIFIFIQDLVTFNELLIKKENKKNNDDNFRRLEKNILEQKEEMEIIKAENNDLKKKDVQQNEKITSLSQIILEQKKEMERIKAENNDLKKKDDQQNENITSLSQIIFEQKKNIAIILEKIENQSKEIEELIKRNNNKTNNSQ